MAYKEIDPGPAPEMGDFYKFTAIGQKFAGIFVRFEVAEGTYGKENRWTFRNKDGAFTITANFDLHRRFVKAALDPNKVGSRKVLVEYLKDAQAKPGQSGMKIFSLKVHDEIPEAPAAPVDSDIPF
jgi:hypothetical protein